MSYDQKITKAEWDKLPWLMSRKVVMNVTGLSDEDLIMMERKGMVHRLKTGDRNGKFFKTELARLCNIG